MHVKRFFILFVFIIWALTNKAQVVTINPTFATQNDQITVLFDASKGNKALMGQAVVYAHTGVITNLSATPSSWRYVQGNWGTDDAKVKMTKIGNDLFSLSLKPSDFYGVPVNEIVSKLAFVFRNQSGNLVGREADGSDIFVPLSNGSFQARIETNNAQVLAISESYTVKGISSKKTALKIYQNGIQVASATNDSVLSFNVASNSATKGKYTYIFEAFNNGSFYRDTVYMVYRGSPAIAVAPLGTKDGINILNDTSVILQIHAPFKEFVFVNGDFNQWELDTKYFMNKTPDGKKFWIQINGLTYNQNYRFQYYIDAEQIKVADIYAEVLLDPNHDAFVPSITYPNLPAYPVGKTSEYVSVLNTKKETFQWQHTAQFVRPENSKLFIYELHLRDFIARHDFETLKDTLDYLQKLGINAIELMPVNEFEGNESWGYNPSFYFAVDKYYGTKNAYKLFIDECHRRGIAVIMDMVLNHSFGQSPMVRMYFDKVNNKPSANNPWFNVSDKHPFGVGYDFNHESQDTKDFTDSVLKFWLTEYKVDGFRFDLSKGFTQKATTDVGAWGNYDASRVAIWKRIYNKIRSYDSTSYIILEHFAENTEEKELANYGMMLWGNMNSNFNEATMGYVSGSNLTGTDYKSRAWNNPHLVAYAESHDEERLMYKNITFGNVNGSYNVKNLNTALKRNEAAMCFLIPLQGPKMIWQFGELGYDFSIDFNGRVGNKPIRWDYLLNANRKRLNEVVSILGWLKNTQSSYSSSNYVYSTVSGVKLYKVNDSTLNTVCVANFNVKTDSIAPVFQHSGTWYNVFTGDSIQVNNVLEKIVLSAGEYKFYVDKRLTPPQTVTGIANERDNDAYLIYPNPSNGTIYIEALELNNEDLQIEILDLNGKLIHQSNIKLIDQAYELNTDDLQIAAGTYILKNLQTNKISQTKIVIQ